MKGTYSGFRRLTCMIAALAVICALAVVPSLSPRGAYAAAEDYAMMTAFVGADETQMNFNWYSFRRTTEQEQLLQIAEGEAGGVFPGEHDEIAVAGALSEGKVNYYVFKASVSGLKADTQYVWRVGTAGAWSETCSFRTLPSGEGLRFVALGDAQIGTNGDEVSDGAAWQDTLDAAAAVSPAFVLHMGDEVESFGSGAATLPQSEREYEQFFGARALRGVPFAGVIGNHEVSKSNWSEHHNFPNLSGSGASSSAGAQSGDYWFVAGNVQFFVLNSNVKDDGVHAAFLAEAAEAGREAYGDRIVWRVAAMHHSLFRGSTLYEQYGEEDIAQRRQSLSAAFTAQDIDLVLTGHEHIYTRAHMMRGTQPVPAEDEKARHCSVLPDGEILYVTLGTSTGNKVFGVCPEAEDAPYIAAMYDGAAPQFTEITVRSGMLKLSTRSAAGEEIDEFTIYKEDPSAVYPQIAGAEDIAVGIGEAFDPLAGVSAADAIEGEIAVSVEGEADTSAAGTYELIYTAENTYGNRTQVRRLVTVTEGGGCSSSAAGEAAWPAACMAVAAAAALKKGGSARRKYINK